MKIRPWFLAPVSLGFVAFLLLIRGETPFPATAQAIDDATDAIIPRKRRAAARKVQANYRHSYGQLRRPRSLWPAPIDAFEQHR
jgi:hypothetical protein